MPKIVFSLKSKAAVKKGKMKAQPKSRAPYSKRNKLA